MSSLPTMNCYYYALIKLAMMLGIDYTACFAGLWSETEFDYDLENYIYKSRKLISNLEKAGIKMNKLNCSEQKERQNILYCLKQGEWLILGIDCFYLPWHHYYKELHSNHYFLAQQTNQEEVCCFDPMYDKEFLRLPHSNVISYVFDIIKINETKRADIQPDLLCETQQIINNHLNTKKHLISLVKKYEKNDKKEYAKLAKYVDALITNRRLFKIYLQNFTLISCQYEEIFEKSFFSRWTAVKNGLYKASLLPNNKAVLEEICELFAQLIDYEIIIAEEIQSKVTKM